MLEHVGREDHVVRAGQFGHVAGRSAPSRPGRPRPGEDWARRSLPRPPGGLADSRRTSSRRPQSRPPVWVPCLHPRREGPSVGQRRLVLLDEEPVQQPDRVSVEAGHSLIHDLLVATALIPGFIHQRPDIFKLERSLSAQEWFQVPQVGLRRSWCRPRWSREGPPTFRVARPAQARALRYPTVCARRSGARRHTGPLAGPASRGHGG